MDNVIGFLEGPFINTLFWGMLLGLFIWRIFDTGVLMNNECDTARCIERREKHGPDWAKSYSISNELAETEYNHVENSSAVCQHCGGIFNGTEWIHKCVACEQNVEAGELLGIFVPSRCKECDDKLVKTEREDGNVCSICNQVYAYCVC